MRTEGFWTTEEDLPDCPFRQPMLQLIVSASGLPPGFQKVADELALALDIELDRADRMVAVNEAEIRIRELELDKGTTSEMLVEVWRVVDATLKSPVLWEKLALAGLKDARVDLGRCLSSVIPEYPRDWGNGFRGNPVITELSGRVDYMLAQDDAEFLDSIDEAQAAIRMVRLFLMEHASPFSDPASGLTNMQTACLGLWQAIEDRMHELAAQADEPTDTSAGQTNRGRVAIEEPQYLQPSYGPSARNSLTLHLIGKAEAASVAAERRADPLLKAAQAVAATPIGNSAPAGDGATPDSPAAAQVAATAQTHLVVRDAIPAATSRDEKEMAARFEGLRQPYALPPMPEASALQAAIETLHAEFPWAADAIDQIGGQLLARQRAGSIELAWAPLLLVGFPGCGKSRMSRRVAEVLGLPNMTFNLAGSHDSKLFMGTARGWNGAQPSPLLGFMLREKAARAVIVLDEVDKITTWSEGAALSATLLNLLEPETSKRWQDSFLQVPCNLSKLLYIATANRLAPLSAPLLSRLEPVLVPEPRRVHFLSVAHAVLADIAKDWGVPAWTLADQVDLAGIAAYAKNVRQLRSLVTRGLATVARDVRVVH